MIENITEVLLKTGAIDADPTGGQPNRLYFDQLLTQVVSIPDFIPGMKTRRFAKRRSCRPCRTRSGNRWSRWGVVGAAPSFFPAAPTC